MKALLFDANRCVGCEACVEACVESNGLPEDAGPQLSAVRYTRLEEQGEVYLRRMCMQCLDPSCASACPVKALHKTQDGPVLYDYDRCIGCRYCMVACPFQIPRYEWSSRLPRVRKCQMCPSRLAEGLPTACAEACPAEATVFGERVALVSEAWKRIADEPDLYSPRVYGMEEAGGTGVLVIGPQELMDTAFDPRIPRESLPERTWVVLSQIPTAVGVVGVTLTGVNWIIRRRMRLMGVAAQVGEDPVAKRREQGGPR